MIHLTVYVYNICCKHLTLFKGVFKLALNVGHEMEMKALTQEMKIWVDRRK